MGPRSHPGKWEVQDSPLLCRPRALSTMANGVCQSNAHLATFLLSECSVCVLQYPASSKTFQGFNANYTESGGTLRLLTYKAGFSSLTNVRTMKHYSEEMHSYAMGEENLISNTEATGLPPPCMLDTRESLLITQVCKHDKLHPL